MRDAHLLNEFKLIYNIKLFLDRKSYNLYISIISKISDVELWG